MYFHQLNFIRFVLAVGVVLFHYSEPYSMFNQGWFGTLVRHSAFRVSFFFFISGFVMTLVYAPAMDTMRAWKFYKKRLTRIMPMYWLAFIVTLLLLVLVKGAAPKGLVIIVHALGLQSLYPGYSLDLNFTTWSISVELFFYLLFPFLIRAWCRLPDKRLILITLFLYVIQSIQYIWFADHLWNGTKGMEEFINTFPLWHLVTFIAGMTTALLAARNTAQQFFRSFSIPLILSALVILFWILFFPNPVLKYIHNGLLIPLFCIFILALFHDRSALSRLLSGRLASRSGDLSYSLFIFQYPVWIVCEEIALPAFRTTNLFFLIYLAVLFVVSCFIHKFLEKPMLVYLRSRVQ